MAIILGANAVLQERSFIMVKPDGVQRGIVGEVIKRFEAKGFRLVALKMTSVSRELAEEHYSDLRSKPFFNGLVEFIISSPVVAMVWQGLGVVATGRKMLGETNPANSAPGTIRGDLCTDIGRNIIHGSDSVPSAEKEIGLWFKDGTIKWQPSIAAWVYENPQADE